MVGEQPWAIETKFPEKGQAHLLSSIIQVKQTYWVAVKGLSSLNSGFSPL